MCSVLQVGKLKAAKEDLDRFVILTLAPNMESSSALSPLLGY